MQVKRKVSGLKEIRADTAKAQRRIDKGDLNTAAALQFFDVVSDKFDREGPGWKALSQMRIDRRHGSEHPILDWSGQLRKAATSWTDQNGLDKIDMSVSGRGDSMTWELSGQKVDNQFGERHTYVKPPAGSVVSLTKSFVNAVTVPARPFWPMDGEWDGTVDKMMVPLESFADNWASGGFGPFDTELKKSKTRKRTR